MDCPALDLLCAGPALEWERVNAERRQRAVEILDRLAAEHPDAAHRAATTRPPLELLVATILSAQCTDERVNQVTADAVPALPDRPRTTSR